MRVTELMKTILKAVNVAFSIYSKIPMPRFTWESADMKYHLCFFPWVGAVIGAVEWLWYCLAQYLAVGEVLFLLFQAAIPILITGGFHMDGFMDTMDAIHSYKEREQKLEILKDPHIGAFSVICLLTYGLLYLAFLSEIIKPRFFGIFCCSFFLSRVLSGVSVVTFHPAKKEGMLLVSSTTAEKKRVRIILFMQCLPYIAVMFYLSVSAALAVIIMMGLCFLFYKKMSEKQFGGITGDLAGFFVTVSEAGAVITLGIASLF